MFLDKNKKKIMHNLLSNHMILPLEVCLGDMRCFRNPRLRWSPRTTFRLDAGFVALRRPRDSPILSLTLAAARPSPRPPWACFRGSRGRPPAAPACSLCHSGPPPAPGTTALPACLWIRLSGTLRAHGAPRRAVLPRDPPRGHNVFRGRHGAPGPARSFRLLLSDVPARTQRSPPTCSPAGRPSGVLHPFFSF